MSQKMNRRDFLKVGCGVGITAVLACGGLTVLAAQTPSAPLIDTQIKGTRSTKKVLVAYATRAGSTVQVAQTIAQTLSAVSARVDVRPLTNVTDLTGYDAVVIGSAIRIGKWLPEAVDFVKTNQAALARVPTAYFLVSAFMRNDTPETRQKAQTYLDPVRQILEPKSVGLFGGRMDYASLSMIDHLVVTSVAKVPEGDWRDWNKIRAWAEGLYPTFTEK